ncbi:phosphotransferase [Vibrio spartinae]|uniref:Homoserine kinase n=1 Tax=Vibrio spartinae TaxID=1918945 RepID=A0A1N6M555_9VIBR|nr:phosphotransferase [Vibrio spartinae]SIO94520.1 Homoserine kinase [Vibrio spartinae]
MKTSLKLNRDEIQHIESVYGLTIKTSAFLGEGSGNTNFLIETNIGDCVLSIIEEQTRDEVEIMANTLVWLALNELRTSLLISPKQQENYAITLRGKPSLLRTFVHGHVHKDLSERMLKQLGVTMAKLHEIPAPDFIGDSIFYEQKKFMDTLDANIDIEYENWAKLRLSELAVDRIHGLPTSVIHSDLFYDNMLFDGEHFVSMIDFELACIYHSVFDIGMAIVGTCSIDGELSLTKAKSLITGYQSRRVILETEFNVLKTYTEYAAVLTSLWRYWRYKIYQSEEHNADKYLEMMTLAKNIEGADFSTLVKPSTNAVSRDNRLDTIYDI